MSRLTRQQQIQCTVCLLGSLAIAGVLTAGATAQQRSERPDRPKPTTRTERTPAEKRLLRDAPGARLKKIAGRTRRVYGTTLSIGNSPEDSADRFRMEHANVFGVPARDLDIRGPLHDQRHTTPVMYDKETGTHKFTLVYYSQRVDGIKVFRSDLRLLVRNEADYPLVLAASSLRNLNGFRPNQAAPFEASKGRTAAKAAYPTLINFTESELVIWAGVDNQMETPRLAYTFTTDDGLPPDEVGIKRTLVTDALTGQVLYDENQLLEIDVDGNVSANTTDGPGADICEAEIPLPMPYAFTNIGGTQTAADVDGDFTIPNGGSSDVTVQSAIEGEYFFVTNLAGANSTLSQNVTPPGPANFMHNAANANEFDRGEVNAYYHANIVRDFTVAHAPAYPVIPGQTNFSMTVNEGANTFCPGNAQYQGDNLRFCASGTDRPNTAWSSVVYHEFGHHIVQVGGSGQGQYGEGMGDVMSVIILDDNRLGLGFFNSCSSSLRDADNTLTYPCSAAIHTCGQLISGCVWDTRNAMILTEPDDYTDILGTLALNAVLLHSGSLIEPDITIDYLTLDDDDGNLNNGGPHYDEICQGFNAHNMDCPILPDIAFAYPNGLPETLIPDQPTTVDVVVFDVTGTAVPDTGTVSYRIGSAGGFTTIPMTETTPNEYEATLPSVPCGETLEFFFSADAAGAETVNDPFDAPTDIYNALSVQSQITVVSYDFESDPGWSVSNAGLTDGPWDRGVPVGGGDRGDPPTDFDGSGACWLTDNVDGNSDVDGGTTTLTTEVFDLTTFADPYVSYARWYSNTAGDSPMADIFEVEITSNGTTWVDLETVGPGGSQVSGGWFAVNFRVSDFVTPSSTVQVRFSASDLGAGSIVEAGVDAFEIVDIICDPCEEPCDDGNPCTLSDQCVGNVCIGTPVDCSGFSDQCNAASCSISGGLGNCDVLTPVANGTGCDDSNPCNVGETCQAGTCTGGSAPDCSGASDQCNQASCSGGGGEGNCDVITPAANGTGCDDGDACNTGESCQAGLCAGGSAVDCSGSGDDCNDASCDAAGSDGNCDILSPANEGSACDAAAGTCFQGDCVETRVFLARDGQQSGTNIGPTTVTIPQGGNATIMVWYEHNGSAGTLLNGYQIMVPDSATPVGGATGSVTYIDIDPGLPGGNSVFLDIERADWVFADDIALAPSYNETPATNRFGVLYNAIPGTGVDASGGLHSLAEFRLTASPDALGTFELAFILPPLTPPHAVLFDPLGANLVTDRFETLIINAVELNCAQIQDCADLDTDGLRDDPCLWWACDGGGCISTPVGYADMGGGNGACPPDGTTDANDRFHALNCFSNISTMGLAGYPCEFAPPAAFNVDAGGEFGSCPPDGVCDANDAFAALNEFEGIATCSCPGGPAPLIGGEPETVARTAVELSVRREQHAAGQLIEVDAHLVGGLKDLRGYQLHVAANGGQSGSLELVDIAVHPRDNRAFNQASAWRAFNTATGQMAAGLDSSGVSVAAGSYLATFTFKASLNAAGSFTVELLADSDDATQRTYLFPSDPTTRIAVDHGSAIINIRPRHDKRLSVK